jgi:CRP-like cAMP-binding protein
MNDLLAAIADWKLDPVDQDALAQTVIGVRNYRRGQTMLENNGQPPHLHLLVRGWAIRYQMLEDGSRQITDFILPGDVGDLSSLGALARNGLRALTPARAIVFDRAALRRAMDQHGRLATAFLELVLNSESILRTWVSCLGLREKREHVAHLLCELHRRLWRRGMVGDHEFDLPLTQVDFADALGMSPIHTNRVLQRMRKEGLITFRGQHVHILHPGKLRDIAEFDASYLGG